MLFGAKSKNRFEGGGLILFSSIEEAIKAEKIMNRNNHEVKLVAPPPQLRKGCDLALEFNLAEKPGVERLLRAAEATFIDLLPLKGSGKLLDIVKTTDFGDSLMVKAGNMKLTYDKNSGTILNISGGGCPDIPYLHISMIDRKITEVPRPKDSGYTLCALMLDRAYTEALALWESGGK